MRSIAFCLAIALLAAVSAAASDSGSETMASAAPLQLQAPVYVVPEPPAESANSPEHLLEYYASCWSRADYPKMYGALSDEAREKLPFEKFCAALSSEKKINGGAKSFSSMKEIKSAGYECEWSLKINYLRSTAAPAAVRASMTQTAGSWRIKSGGVLPLDYSPFDR